jgi:hypothetical protein
MESSSTAVNVFVILSFSVPLVALAVIIPLFFRAARRNDEREALEKQAAENWPTG